jgi:hypothetical protein
MSLKEDVVRSLRSNLLISDDSFLLHYKHHQGFFVINKADNSSYCRMGTYSIIQKLIPMKKKEIFSVFSFCLYMCSIFQQARVVG